MKEVFQLNFCTTAREGNFNGDCEWTNNNAKMVLQFSASYKGVLEPLGLNMGDLTDYDEWYYTNASGNDLMLIINNVTGHANIFYNGEKAFVIVNGFSFSFEGFEEADWTKEMVETLADTFDFSQF